MTNTIKLHSLIKDVPIARMRVSLDAQRDLRPARVDYLTSEFDPEQLGYPVVSYRDGHYWIIDGQHRIEAAKRFLGEWESQSLTCRVYSGLSEKDEAEMFDRLANVLSVSAFDRFKVRVKAGRPIESAVKRVVEKAGLKISRDKNAEGSVSAVSALVKIYQRTDGATLGRTLEIVHKAFGKDGLEARIIEGLSLVCERYNGALNDDECIERLQTVRGGMNTLNTRAALLKKQIAMPYAECIAAATVDLINSKRGGKKLPSWWKETADDYR